MFPEDTASKEQENSKVKTSKLESAKSDVYSTSSEYTTLQNKLESKLGKLEREKLEEEIKLRQEMQSMMRGKLF